MTLKKDRRRRSFFFLHQALAKAERMGYNITIYYFAIHKEDI